jgi:predicted ArsR family transcriptional regulator
VLGELARAAGVHANTVRGHVAALEGGGVLVRDHVATGARGRQRTMVAEAVLRQRNAAASLVNLVTAVSALVIGLRRRA